MTWREQIGRSVSGVRVPHGHFAPGNDKGSIMFRIELRLTDRCLTGLEALDECRRLQLEDNVILRHNAGCPVECSVSEAFARLWFGKRQTRAVRKFDRWELLVPGDLVSSGTVWAVLTEERIKELWLASVG